VGLSRVVAGGLTLLPRDLDQLEVVLSPDALAKFVEQVDDGDGLFGGPVIGDVDAHGVLPGRLEAGFGAAVGSALWRCCVSGN